MAQLKSDLGPLSDAVTRGIRVAVLARYAAEKIGRDRVIAKSVNFALLYSISNPTLARQIGDRAGPVGAAAVGNDDLVGLLAANLLQRLREAVFFIESRYDDGHAHGAPVDGNRADGRTMVPRRVALSLHALRRLLHR